MSFWCPNQILNFPHTPFAAGPWHRRPTSTPSQPAATIPGSASANVHYFPCRGRATIIGRIGPKNHSLIGISGDLIPNFKTRMAVPVQKWEVGPELVPHKSGLLSVNSTPWAPLRSEWQARDALACHSLRCGMCARDGDQRYGSHHDGHCGKCRSPLPGGRKPGKPQPSFGRVRPKCCSDQPELPPNTWVFPQRSESTSVLDLPTRRFSLREVKRTRTE